MANQEYCSDPSLWGKGMYISLKDIVESYMSRLDPDDITYDVSRRHVVRQARLAIQEFNFTSVKNFKYIELELSKSLQVVLPPDFVNYYKISWIDEDGLTYPMVQNGRYNLGNAVLQDNDYNFICDSDGNWITVDGTSPTFGDPPPVYSSDINTDRSQIYENGFFKIDKSKGVIKFSSDAKERKILLEYFTDGHSGLSDSEIKIHKFAQEAVDEDIYFRLIQRRRNVPQSEKQRARRARNIAERKMRSKMNPVREEDILQILRARTRQVKQT